MTDGGGTRPSRLRVDAAEAGMRADVFLAMAFPCLSRTRIRQKIQMGESLRNGKRYATSTRLSGGDEITVRNMQSQQPLQALVTGEGLVRVAKPGAH